MVSPLQTTVDTILSSRFDRASPNQVCLGGMQFFVTNLGVIKPEFFPRIVALALDDTRRGLLRVLAERKLYSCQVLIDRADLLESYVGSDFQLRVRFAVGYPKTNPSFYRNLGDEGMVPDGFPTSEKLLSGGFAEEPRPRVDLQLKAADPLTPGSELVPLAREISLVGDLARRNPSLPYHTLRDLLVAGSWDAWLNPSAAMVLLSNPGEDLVVGAQLAARDCLREQFLRGNFFGSRAPLHALLRFRNAGSIPPQRRQVLQVLTELFQPMLTAESFKFPLGEE